MFGRTIKYAEGKKFSPFFSMQSFGHLSAQDIGSSNLCIRCQCDCKMIPGLEKEKEKLGQVFIHCFLSLLLLIFCVVKSAKDIL
jgi:hypothetical protein